MGLDPSAYPPTGVTAAVTRVRPASAAFPIFRDRPLGSIRNRAGIFEPRPGGLISFPYHEEKSIRSFFSAPRDTRLLQDIPGQILGLKIRISEEIAQSSATESLRALKALSP
jgi:hypothetical protein